jgi:predicted nuclease with TOPRIM domain
MSEKSIKDQGKQFEETVERLNETIREKDELLEEKERDQQNAINEIDSNSQAKL